MPERRVTIHDVADRAAVSRQTVTRAMNDMGGINAATKQRVLDAARELGYHPSRFGRGLVRSEHRNLGLMIDNLTNPYYPELASAVVGRAAELGWTVVLSDGSGVPDRTARYQGMADQVDALIGYVGAEQAELDRLMPGVPVVRFDPPTWRDAPCGVKFDNKPGVEKAAEHLLGAGVEHPVMLDSSRPGDVSPRARNVVRAMERRGVDCRVFHAAGDRLGDGIEATSRLVESWPETDAIVCFNDMTAFGALKALRHHDVDVPGRVRVIGIDGLTAGSYVSPELTTLALDMSKVATVAIEIALGRLDGSIGPGTPQARRKVAHQLIVRESA